jgi:hypothetical protein
MDLFGKIAVLVIALIMLSALAFILFEQNAQSKMTKGDAVSFVLDYLKQRNSDSNISVVSVSPSNLTPNSWRIVVSIVSNATKPCPTVMIEECDYPAFMIACNPEPENLYTEGCVVHGISGALSYFISMPSIAIVRSYNASGVARSYVSTFGYNNTFVKASYHAQLNAASTPLNRNFTNVWLINYTATNANYSNYFIMDSSGSILANYTINKSMH